MRKPSARVLLATWPSLRRRPRTVEEHLKTSYESRRCSSRVLNSPASFTMPITRGPPRRATRYSRLSGGRKGQVLGLLRCEGCSTKCGFRVRRCRVNLLRLSGDGWPRSSPVPFPSPNGNLTSEPAHPPSHLLDPRTTLLKRRPAGRGLTHSGCRGATVVYEHTVRVQNPPARADGLGHVESLLRAGSASGVGASHRRCNSNRRRHDGVQHARSRK